MYLGAIAVMAAGTFFYVKKNNINVEAQLTGYLESFKKFVKPQ